MRVFVHVLERMVNEMELNERIVDSKKLAAIRNYEDVLIGNTKKFFKSGLGQLMSDEELAQYWWTYGLKTLCHFDCTQALNYCDDKLVHQLGLDKTLDMFATKPHNPKGNYDFALAKVYPTELSYTKSQRCIEEFEHANHIGIYEKINDAYIYPKGFFTGADGDYNIGVCLNYCIANFLTSKSQLELYEFFASPDGEAFLQKYKFPKKKIKGFDDVLDYFYAYQPEESKNLFLYQLVKFNRDRLSTISQEDFKKYQDSINA